MPKQDTDIPFTNLEEFIQAQKERDGGLLGDDSRSEQRRRIVESTPRYLDASAIERRKFELRKKAQEKRT